MIANGRNTAGSAMSLMKVANNAGLIFFIAFPHSKLAPTHINANGVAVCAIPLIVLSIT